MYAQFKFGEWARTDNCNLYWSPRNQLPFKLPQTMPAAVTLNDLVFEKYPETMTLRGRILERLLTPNALKRANRILTHSDAIKQELANYDTQLAGKIVAIPLASNIRQHECANTKELRPSQPYFIYCGSIEPRKNLQRLMNAFLAIKQSASAPPHKMVLVSGGGWKNTKELELIARHAEHIELHTSLTEAQKAELIRHSDFLVLPSLYEGFGIPLVEALCLGRPILTSNRGAMQEVAGPAAVLVDPTNQQQIETELLRLCRDEQLRSRLSKEALNRANEFSWDKTAEQTLSALVATAADG